MTKKAQLPDGTVLEFPDDTPDAVIDAAAKRQLGIESAPADNSTLRGLGLGFREPLDIAASRLENIAGADIVNVLGPRVGIPLAQGMENVRNLGNVLGLPSAANVLSETNKMRAANTSKIAQLFGNIGGVTAMLPTRAVVAPRSLLEAAGGGAAASAALSQAQNEPELASDILAGSIFGAALKPVSDVVSGVIAPKASDALKTLAKEKVYPTVGMILSQGEDLGSKFVTGLEEGITSLPGIGDLVSLARDGVIQDFGRAAVNRAAQFIDQTVPKNLSGEEAVGWVKKKLGEGYNKLVPTLDFTVGVDFLDDAQRIFQSLNIPSSRQNLLDDWSAILKDNIFRVMDNNGRISGKNLQDVLSNLSDTASNLMKQSDGFERRLGTGVAELRRAWFDALAKQNASQADELQRLNAGYSITAQLQKATSQAAGRITPASLERAVTAFGRGQRRGPLADLARGGRIIPSKTPDSGTARRAFVGTAATGGLVGLGNEIAQRYGYEGITPGEASAIALIAAPYTPAGRAAIAKILQRSPGKIAQATGNVFRLGISPAVSSSTIKRR